MSESKNNNFYLVLGLILIIAFSRLIPHYPNFTPLCSIALFGAKYFNNRYLAYILPIFAVWLSDIIINNFVLGQYFNEFTLFYSGFYWQYGSIILITLFGKLTLKNISVSKILGVSISSSLIFFVISNFGVWVSSSFYPNTFSGLITCYVAAIPFYYGTLGGTIFYSFLLFGTFELISRRTNQAFSIR